MEKISKDLKKEVLTEFNPKNSKIQIYLLLNRYNRKKLFRNFFWKLLQTQIRRPAFIIVQFCFGYYL